MLGSEVEALKDLEWWHDKEVTEYEVALLTSLKNFAWVVLYETIGCRPTELQMDILDWLQHGDPNSPRDDKGVMAFRLAAKTTLTSIAIVWHTYREPRVTIALMAGKDDLAQAIVSECRRTYGKCDILAHLNPDNNKGDKLLAKDNASSFNVCGALGGKSPTFKASAISGNVTGNRAHITLRDDIEQPNNSGTAGLREKLEARDNEVNRLIHTENSSSFKFKPFTIYLGTPHTEESIYYKKIASGVPFRIWPGRYPNEKYMKTIGHLVSPFILNKMKEDPSLCTGYGPNFDEGAVTEPTRFSEDDMLFNRQDGDAEFAKQYMLDVSLQNIEKFPLKINDLIVADLDKQSARGRYLGERESKFELKNIPNVGMPNDRFYSPSFMSEEIFDYDQIIMAIDPSGRGADETTYAVVATLNGYFFLLKSGGLNAYDVGYSEEVLTKLANIAKEYKVKEIVTETNFGDGMFDNAFKPILASIYPCKVTESRANKQKELRIIETLEPIFSRRRMIINRSAIDEDYKNIPAKAPSSEQPTYRLFYQIARITRDRQSLKHDDRLDSLELAVRTLKNALSIDNVKAEGRKVTKAWDDKYRTKVDFRGGISSKTKKKRKSFYS